MKHVLLGAAAAALLFTVQARACIIVTNSTIEVFMHELAHCNGWEHPAFKPGYDPPYSFVHEYEGPEGLTVFQVGGDWNSLSEQLITREYVLGFRNGLKVRFIDLNNNRTVPQLCGMLWKQHNIQAAQKDIDTLAGCTVRE